ncbi:MAG: alpha/beta hydrolase-fold protein [Ignavibacteriales bacterium]
MKKQCMILLFFLGPAALFAQTQFNNFISRVNSLSSNPSAQTAVIDSFLNSAKSKGIPFIENNTANFIYRGYAAEVSVAGDFNGWNGTANKMTRLSNTDFFYYSRDFEPNARVDYKLVLPGNNWILDPLNPHQISGGYGPNSELAMPGYIQPWEIAYKAGIKHGTIEERNIYSINAAATYQLRIYLPPGYNPASSAVYPTVYFQDGFEYMSLGSAVNIIDNLLDSNSIRPFIAVFVQPNNRNEEYAYGKRNQYRLFFVNELVPFIDSLYRTAKNPAQRLVLGDSFGGNISALIAFNHPDVFGNTGQQSGAYWPNSYEAASVISSSHSPLVKLFSVWGTYEDLYQFWRPFKDSLNNKGYQLKWAEYPEGHSWGLWRATLDDMLEYFFPANPTNVSENKQTQELCQLRLMPNYPNPFNPSTSIRFQLPEACHVRLSLFNLLGKEIAVLLDTDLPAGVHLYNLRSDEFRLSSGTYYYHLRAGGNLRSGKMVLLK